MSPSCHGRRRTILTYRSRKLTAPAPRRPRNISSASMRPASTRSSAVFSTSEEVHCTTEAQLRLEYRLGPSGDLRCIFRDVILAMDFGHGIRRVEEGLMVGATASR